LGYFIFIVLNKCSFVVKGKECQQQQPKRDLIVGIKKKLNKIIVRYEKRRITYTKAFYEIAICISSKKKRIHIIDRYIHILMETQAIRSINKQASKLK